MAFDQTTRNVLQRFVNDARKVLEIEFSRQLQNEYGLDPSSGAVAPLEKLSHLTDAKRETARILRDILSHYLTGETGKDTKSAMERIVREQAFTVLNRILALRMAEARGLLIESINNGYQAQGFQLYARVMGNSLGETGDTYRNYLFSVFDELAQELPELFNRYSPQGRLFPRETSLLQIIELVNHPEISTLWAEDETIGWVFQYFNSKEERKKMRDESDVPRNSRELAVRNQFFTPRYVVEFLVDNSLGRLWFNATGGNTVLREQCHYLLVKPDEKPAQVIRLRDPRTLKLLDPACGSMHFGLYAFDLFMQIYKESWTWEQQHGPGSLDVSTIKQKLLPLCQTYTDEQSFLLDVPRLIIENNIYGVDIDPRATQIASLALWLRAQRAWHEEGIKAAERPQIGRGHVVAAVAPPQDKEIKGQLKTNLNGKDAELFDKTLQLLKDLPELGVLLKVEHELPALIRKIYGESGGLFKQSDEETWHKAEMRLREALIVYAQAANSSYQSRLFAQDAMELLRMIDLVREKYDVVVMNPPFGVPSNNSLNYCGKNYYNYNKNLLCAFLLRAYEMLNSKGFVGAIYDRTTIIKNTYEDFRRSFFLQDDKLQLLTDLGWGVLDDANVEVTTSIFSASTQKHSKCKFIDLRMVEVEKKGDRLKQAFIRYKNEQADDQILEFSSNDFLSFPNAVLGYDFPKFVVNLFKSRKNIRQNGVQVIAGHTILSERYFRYWWEVPADRAFHDNGDWQRFYNGGEYCRYISHLCDAVYYGKMGEKISTQKSTILRNLEVQGTGVIGYGKRGYYIDAHVLPKGFISSVEGQAVLLNKQINPFSVLAFFNSRIFQTLINLYCGQHKYPGYVHLLPTPDWESEQMKIAARIAEKIYFKKFAFEASDETSPYFFYENTEKFWSINYIEKMVAEKEEVHLLESKVNDLIEESYQLNEAAIQYVEKYSEKEPSTGGVIDSDPTRFWANNLFHYIIGCVFGRWDIRLTKTNKDLPKYSNPFIEIPHFPPAYLNANDDLDNYPLDINFKGVYSSDYSSGGDLLIQIEKAFCVVFTDAAEEIEAKVCEALGWDSLKQGLTQFFSEHMLKYSKGRKQAPIYWPLSTSSGSYTLWLYYPGLTNQTLYTSVNDFLDPKIKQVARDAANLRNKGSKRSSADEKQLDKLQTLERELIELRDILLKIAPNYNPNQDDGVQITAAPLWQLFRHKNWQKVLKDTWTKLEKGDYDWSHMAMNYWPGRVREKCKVDKSVAIAHGLEELYTK